MLVATVLSAVLACALPPGQSAPPAPVVGNATGQWTGDIRTPVSYSPIPLYLKLEETAKGVTGTAGPSPVSQNPIKDVKREGRTLRFTVSAEHLTYAFDLRVADDGLEGEARGQDTLGNKWEGKATLKRDVEAGAATKKH